MNFRLHLGNYHHCLQPTKITSTPVEQANPRCCHLCHWDSTQKPTLKNNWREAQAEAQQPDLWAQLVPKGHRGQSPGPLASPCPRPRRPRPQPRHSLALLAVIENDGVIVAAGNDGLAVGAEVEAVDLVRVLAEDLGHAEAPQHVVRQLHPARRAAPSEGGGAEGSRAGLQAVAGTAGPGGAGRSGAVRDGEGPRGRRRAAGSARSGRGEAAPPHCVRHLAAPAGPRGTPWERGVLRGRARRLLGRGRAGWTAAILSVAGRVEARALPARRGCQYLSPSPPLPGLEVGRGGARQGRAAVTGPGFVIRSLRTRPSVPIEA